MGKKKDRQAAVAAPAHISSDGNVHQPLSAPSTRSQTRSQIRLAAAAAGAPPADPTARISLPHRPSKQQPSSNEKPHQQRQNVTRQAGSAAAPPHKVESPVRPPHAPKPTEAYLVHANGEPGRLEEPRRLLVLLDLNGTLLFRPRLDNGAVGPHGRRAHILRPGAKELISYLFNNHAVMVYTSAMRRNAVVCVDALLHHLTDDQRKQLIGIRTREKLGLTNEQLNAKVQVYKPLEPVWSMRTVQASAKKHGCVAWDASNTVLLDDSAEKARANPHNLLQVPEFKLEDGISTTAKLSVDISRTEATIMQLVQTRLQDLSWEVSVARRIRVWQQQQTTLLDSSSKPESTSGSDNAINNKDAQTNTNGGNDDNDDDGDDEDDEDNEDGGVPIPLIDDFKNLNLGRQ